MRPVLGTAALLATALLTVSGPAAGPTAAATPGAATDAGVTTRAAAKPVRALIIFDKSSRNPWRSRVIWKAYRGGELIERRDWRAGSGFGGKGTRDACRRNIGWLPNGVYSPLQHDDYHGTLIHGRAFALGRKACHDGTVRTDLFLHTESGARNTQCPDRKGDQLCRWEYPKVNDYRSRGCIKMSPRDLRQLVRAYQQWFEPQKRYPLRRLQVRVRS